ncbi:MAG TPA: sn-glycerol-1-phosphate dehydrogenase [Candidatus Anaerostipes excrementavium]|uniref:Sn-glycerol-1-phosphate dehydrogenase n=1 Tax=Candidatus Anaerostipes excrementavium TaxID=2838463 RepID=A0A9D1WUJ4_9FIRM|nr:sn-glycerol-1-phosphate dehydrogenase [uncultured Anaerostipes sp.]HIX67429.1 sn-glycerol-1-phosphate dehydrogenase [Candidatus Anaerostipes excrementavium]
MEIDLNEFNGVCSCGRNHQLQVKEIYLEEHAIHKIPEILDKKPYQNYQKFVMICDENTYEAAGREIEKIVSKINTVKLEADSLHADEVGVEKVKHSLDSMEEIDCLVAVGSGTIHDLTRYCAFKKNIPFISVPTAASVDGYVSTVAAMSWNGMKKSMIAVSPILVVADSCILANAPMRLTASGVGDLLGKYTALVDWKIAHLLTGEYICPKICEMEYNALHELRDSLEGLEDKRIDAYEKLMYGLLLSGLAMQMTGNSRPASGAEHHMAHFWEMAVIHNELAAYHGEKVGVGLILTSEIYHQAAEFLKKGKFLIKPHVDIEWDLLKTSFRKKALYESIEKINQTNLLDQISQETLYEKTDEIVRLIEQIPEKDQIEKILRIVHGASSLEDIGLRKETKEKTAQTAPYIRDRITFLRILKYYNFYDKVIK